MEKFHSIAGIAVTLLGLSVSFVIIKVAITIVRHSG